MNYKKKNFIIYALIIILLFVPFIFKDFLMNSIYNYINIETNVEKERKINFNNTFIDENVLYRELEKNIKKESFNYINYLEDFNFKKEKKDIENIKTLKFNKNDYIITSILKSGNQKIVKINGKYFKKNDIIGDNELLAIGDNYIILNTIFGKKQIFIQTQNIK